MRVINKIEPFLPALVVANSVFGFACAMSLAFHFFGYDSRFLTIPYRGASLCLVLVVLLGSFFNRQSTGITKVRVAYLLFWFLYFVRASFDVFVIKIQNIAAMTANDGFIFALFVTAIPSLVLLIYPASWSISRKFLHQSLVISLISIPLVVYAGKNMFSTDSGLGRFYEEGMLNPISVGHLGVSILVISFVLLLKGAGRIIKLASLVNLMGGLVLIYLAASRGPVLSLITVVIFYFVAIRGIKKKALLIGTIGLSVILFYFIFQHFESSGSSFESRVMGAFFDDSGRSELMEEALGGFYSMPLWGSSMVLDNGYYPHNIYVESLMAGGVFLFAPLAYVTTVAVYHSFMLIRRQNGDEIFALLFVQYLTFVMVSGAIWNSWTFFGLLALVVNRGELACSSNRQIRCA